MFLSFRGDKKVVAEHNRKVVVLHRKADDHNRYGGIVLSYLNIISTAIGNTTLPECTSNSGIRTKIKNSF